MDNNNFNNLLIKLNDRLSQREQLRNIAYEYQNLECGDLLYENEVVPDICRVNNTGVMFTCSPIFQCLPSNQGTAHSCVSQYINCTNTPFLCVLGPYACPGLEFYECASFRCGFPESANANIFGCQSNLGFGCNSDNPFNCLNDFTCDKGSVGFSCTKDHNCMTLHKCVTSSVTGSFACGIGAGNQDTYNCKLNFNCSSGINSSSTTFACFTSSQFDCGANTKSSFKCTNNFLCGKKQGFVCTNTYSCENKVNCDKYSSGE